MVSDRRLITSEPVEDVQLVYLVRQSVVLEID